MTFDKQKFLARAEALRKRNGWTEIQASKRLFKASYTLERFKADKCSPSLRTLERAQQLLTELERKTSREAA